MWIIGCVGAGLSELFVGIKDVGEPAPTAFKKPVGAGSPTICANHRKSQKPAPTHRQNFDRDF